MRKSKSPFRNFTTEEVLQAEANSFVVQIGNDMYSKKGNFVFSSKEAKKHYSDLLYHIKLSIYQGTEKQKKAALNCLMKLEILPLRIQ